MGNGKDENENVNVDTFRHAGHVKCAKRGESIIDSYRC